MGARAALAKGMRLAPPFFWKTATGTAAVNALPLRGELDILVQHRQRASMQPVLRWANENVLNLECREIGEH